MVQKPGSIVHVEIASNDLPRTKQFFNTVFGWKMQEMPEMNYTMFQAPGVPHGGFTPPQGGMPAGTLNHILSNDIVATARKIEQNGGAILVPKTEIPKIGWFAGFREPGVTGPVSDAFVPPSATFGSFKCPSRLPPAWLPNRCRQPRSSSRGSRRPPRRPGAPPRQRRRRKKERM